MRLLMLALLMACANQPELPQAKANHPSGSRVTCGFAAYYFEHQESDGGWSEVGLILPDGGTPVSGTDVNWAIIPQDAGIIRVRSVR